MKSTIPAALAWTVLVLPACDGGPMSPQIQVPNVVGTYSGALEAGQLTLHVAQSGVHLTITGTLAFRVPPIAFPIDPIAGDIDAGGFVAMTSGGTSSAVAAAAEYSSFYEMRCGSSRTVEGSITFTGDTAQYFDRGASDLCGTWTRSGTLTRVARPGAVGVP